ncbi:MAG: hypothetical protein HZA13_07680 [Nitrospirae bacterium]|nr:hypothetical protein [Nitrospirota bacterium]
MGLPGDLIERLSRREKIFLAGGAAFFVLLLLYGLSLGYSYLTDRIDVKERLIQQKERDLKEIVTIKDDYIQLRDRVKEIDTKLRERKEFSLLSFLEGLANSKDIRTNIAYMKPQTLPLSDEYRESIAEVKIDNILLNQAIEVISAIENSPNLIRIKRLSMKTRFSDPSHMDVILLVATIEKI